MSIFNRFNLTKILIIFVVGLISRFLVNVYLDVNVFLEFASIISLTYYAIFSFVVVSIHGLIDYFNFNVIPNFVSDFFSHISNKILYLCSKFKVFNFKGISEVFNDLAIKNTLEGADNYKKNNILKKNG